ncbi:MAG: hypothetical protein JNK35_12340 [Phycisphaerae bacterium]|nr:hypothetical protein [Phycisphaerae bacterium]
MNRHALLVLAGQGAALCAAAVLIVAGTSKLLDPASFRKALEAHGVVPPIGASAAVLAAPALEFLVACAAVWALLCRRTARACGLCAAVFAGLAAYCLALTIRPPVRPSGCGCGFTTQTVESWAPLLATNASASAVLACLALGASTARAPHRRSSGCPPA